MIINRCIISMTKFIILSSNFSDEHDYRYIMYDDNLVTISDAGKELGEFKVSVSQASHNVN